MSIIATIHFSEASFESRNGSAPAFRAQVSDVTVGTMIQFLQQQCEMIRVVITPGNPVTAMTREVDNFGWVELLMRIHRAFLVCEDKERIDQRSG